MLYEVLKYCVENNRFDDLKTSDLIPESIRFKYFVAFIIFQSHLIINLYDFYRQFVVRKIRIIKVLTIFTGKCYQKSFFYIL